MPDADWKTLCGYAMFMAIDLSAEGQYVPQDSSLRIEKNLTKKQAFSKLADLHKLEETNGIQR